MLIISVFMWMWLVGNGDSIYSDLDVEVPAVSPILPALPQISEVLLLVYILIYLSDL